MLLRKKWLLAAFLLVPAILLAETAIPVLSRPVMDTANIVDEKTQTELDGMILQLQEENGTQVAVLTVPSIGDETIDSFGLRVAEQWKLGQKGADNGVLITVALAEHKIRIDVGYGLESTLTDAKCGLIIRNCMKNAFKAGDYSTGIKNGVEAVIGVIRNDEALNAQLALYAKKEQGGGKAPFVIPLLMLAFFFGISIPDSMGAGPFGLYWFKAVLTGQPFVRRKRPAVKEHPVAAGGTEESGFGDDDTSSSDDGDSYSGGGGDFGGGGASDSW